MNFDQWWKEEIDSLKYWAYAGWCAHAEQNKFHPDWDTVEPFLEHIAELENKETGCAECGCKASDGYALYCVKCSKPMREWVSLTDEQITTLLRRVTIEANLDLLYTTEGGMKTFALQLQQLLKEQNEL